MDRKRWYFEVQPSGALAGRTLVFDLKRLQHLPSDTSTPKKLVRVVDRILGCLVSGASKRELRELPIAEFQRLITEIEAGMSAHTTRLPG